MGFRVGVWGLRVDFRVRVYGLGFGVWGLGLGARAGCTTG